ncbi:N-acetylmannosamine-6-phosphate 2-epimerase [Lacticaseibacillus parakribbianus]|uniref:N-acetylmannosamine-6-phosphate 2-epimerase n=1 Tax=Lacticaseibacillus parakribbianus TaxID=2970927 RepID=UPI0021CB0EEC|nr:N-acetylmannosamine-6-phosphate 2-epimerase [Lacticaseibacillus parakribbianus]
MSVMTSIHRGLIVSCQALASEPLFGSEIMARMAIAAKQAKAVGIRANTVTDIQAIQQVVALPIIGIIKRDYPGSKVYITATAREVDALAACHVPIIAMDATTQPRPKQSLAQLVAYTRDKYPDVLLMADTSTLEEAINAEHLGFDFIGTTLRGYTDYTRGQNIADHDFAYLRDVLNTVHTPVIAEGNIDTPEKAKLVLSLGAYSVVVGGAITRPQQIAERFVKQIETLKQEA